MRLILYTKRMEKMISFYETHFDYRAERNKGDRIVELIPATDGVHLLLHPQAKPRARGKSRSNWFLILKTYPGFVPMRLKQG